MPKKRLLQLTASFAVIIPYTSAIVFVLGTALGPAKGIAAALAFFAALVVIGVSPAGEKFFHAGTGLRDLNEEEKAVVLPAWERVCAAAGVDPSSFCLKAVNLNIPNAFAVGLRTVAVTPALLREADHEELCGVLAHELGHRLHDVFVLIYLELIAQMVATLLALIMTVLYAFALAVVPPQATKEVLAAAAAALLPVWAAVAAGQINASFLRPAQKMRSELEADRFAAQIGFGYGFLRLTYRLFWVRHMPMDEKFTFLRLRKLYQAVQEG